MNLTLNRLNVGEQGTVYALNATGNLHRRLMDIGLVVGTRVKCIMQSPLGDPKAYLIRGAVIAIRQEDGEKIVIEKSNCGEVSQGGTYRKISRNVRRSR